MYYPIGPVPLSVYPSGIQGAVLVVNPNDSYITVSNSSAPMSGTGVPPRGNVTWPANTPLWVYGPVGAFVDVGGAPTTYNGDIAAQFAYALGTTTVKTDPVTPTPGTDEDTMRVLDQPAINALTAADKASPFIIYNTTTSSINYVVNGNVVVPPSGGASIGAVTKGFNLTTSFVATTLFTAAVGLKYVDAWFSNNNGTNATTGGFTLHVLPDPTQTAVSGAGASNQPIVRTFATTTETQVLQIADGNQNLTLRNVKYNATTGDVTAEMSASATATWNTRISWEGI